MSTNIQSGALVKLKSGGPLMTVTGMDMTGLCRCSYSRGGGIETVDGIAAEALQPISDVLHLLGPNGEALHVMFSKEIEGGGSITVFSRKEPNASWQVEEDPTLINFALAEAYRRLFQS